MIRIRITDETRSIDVKVDAPYSPDVIDDLINRVALLVLLPGEPVETEIP